MEAKGHEIVQIGRVGEEVLTPNTKFGLSFKELKTFLEDNMDVFISVDNFLPHFCNHYKLKSGIVIWAKSDPTIFGYPQNINLLKDRKYLRQDQFGLWDYIAYDPDSFILPNTIIEQL